MLKNKKWIAISLCVGLVASSILPVANSFAEELAEQGFPLFTTKPAVDSIVAPNERLQQPETVTLQTEASDSEKSEEPIYQGTKVTLEPDPTAAEEFYNMSQSEMEQYLKEGFTLHDLYQADALANVMMIKPNELLELKQAEGDWAKAEAKAQINQALEQIKPYIEKHPKEYQQLKKQSLTPQAELLLMSIYDRNRSVPVKDLVQQYKKSPASFVDNHVEKTKSKDVKDISLFEKKGSNGAPTEREMENLKKLAEKTNTPLEDLVQKYKTFQKGDQ